MVQWFVLSPSCSVLSSEFIISCFILRIFSPSYVPLHVFFTLPLCILIHLRPSFFSSSGCYVCLSSSIPGFAPNCFCLFVLDLCDLTILLLPFWICLPILFMSGFDPHLGNYLCLRQSLPLCGVCFYYKWSRQINIVSPCDHFGSLRSHMIDFPTIIVTSQLTHSLVQRPLACTKTAHSVIHLWYKQSNTSLCLTLQEWPIRFQFLFSSPEHHSTLNLEMNHWRRIKIIHLLLLTNTRK